MKFPQVKKLFQLKYFIFHLYGGGLIAMHRPTLNESLINIQMKNKNKRVYHLIYMSDKSKSDSKSKSVERKRSKSDSPKQRERSKQREGRKQKDTTDKIFLTNINGEVDQQTINDEVKKLFQKYGQVAKVTLRKHRNGFYYFGFLQFVKPENAVQAIKQLDQHSLFGKNMRVRQDRQSQGCFVCKRTGHYARECPQNKYRERRRSRSYQKYDRRSRQRYERRPDRNRDDRRDRFDKYDRHDRDREDDRHKHSSKRKYKRSSRSISNSSSQSSYKKRRDHKEKKDKDRRRQRS